MAASSRLLFRAARSAAAWFITLALAVSFTRAEWHKDDTTLAWKAGGKTVWSFSFDPARGKAFFEPLTVNGGPSLTNFRPADHPHHYSLWFSWKYINRTNYWEEQAGPGISAGKTSWSAPAIETKPDGSARIRMVVTYVPRAKATIDLVENREIAVSAPAEDGTYTIDWRARFMAGPDGALLDRTAMPGEPRGAYNGGYAGLSIRLAGDPLAIEFLSTEKTITEWERSRNRPNVPAVAANLTDGGKAMGAVAILSDQRNVGSKPPWYLINQGEMRFMCAAILAPTPRQIAPGNQFDLNYRIVISAKTFTPESLSSTHATWSASPAPASAENR